MMHQHMHHDLCGHALGEVVDRNAHQRHRRKGEVGDNRIDSGTEVEDHLELGKTAEHARLRLPDRRIADTLPIDRIVGHERDRTLRAHTQEALTPAAGRPVFGAAGDEESERAFHSGASQLVRRLSFRAATSLPGGLAAAATVPSTVSRLNAAANSARVYSLFGLAKRSTAGPSSTILPLRITNS